MSGMDVRFAATYGNPYLTGNGPGLGKWNVDTRIIRINSVFDQLIPSGLKLWTGGFNVKNIYIRYNLIFFCTDFRMHIFVD